MTTAITTEHQQRAFELLHRPDWPGTLAELLTAARCAALVQGLAQRLANGQGITTPADLAELTTAPGVPLRAWDYPPRRAGHNPTATPARRRSDDAGLDRKRLAAGERNDD